MTQSARWVLAVVAVLATPLAFAQGRRGGANAAATTQSSSAAPTGPTVPAVAADVCIPQERAHAATECPANSVHFGTHAQTAPPGAARATAEDRGHKAAKKGAPTIQLDEATARRRGNLQRRSRDLLVREVQLTATLVRNMATTDTHRPDALMRLAENLQELGSVENGMGQELEEQIFAARRANNARQVAELQRTQQQHFTQAQQFRTQLIRTFEVLVTDHPRYQRMDEVLFYLAFAYQDSHDQANARRVYLTLIQRFPQSRFIPNAYLSFAEFFFEQGAMEEARQFYQRVIDINTPENTVYGYALYKMAWVYFNLSDFDNSLQTFFRVVDYARQHQDNPSVAPLLRSARTELVGAYGAVYGVSRPLRPAEALNTFRRYGADENDAYAMFEHLGELYQDNGQWPNSIAVYHELMSSRATSDKFCHWQAMVAKAVVASQNRENQMREVQRLLDVYDTYRAANSQRSAEARGACRDATARIVFDVASHWHLEAIGRSAEGQQQTRGTRDNATMARAAQLYNLLLDRFPDLDQVTFPDYDRRDWPSRYRIAYYAADILRDQNNFEECGPAYDRVVEMNPTGEFTEDAAYKAVLCYNDLFSRDLEHASQARPARRNTGSAEGATPAHQTAAQVAAAAVARLTPRDFNTQETGMLRAFSRYVCFVGNNQPGANASAAPQVGAEGEDPRTVLLTIKYRRAYLYYAANKFEESATLFQDIAFSDPNAPDPENLREIAADLYLDCLNVMGSIWNPNRPACFDGMSREVPRLKDRFCTAAVRGQHTDFCDRMDGLQCQILRKHAESLHTAHRFAEAGHEYVQIVRTHPECQRSADSHVDEILYNAAIEYDAANMLGRSMRVRDVLVQRFLPRGSVWAQRALYRLAGNYHAIQVFSRAADFYEQYADYVHDHSAEATRADPEAVTQAADALRQATIFRIGLGEDDHALDNAAKFARYFGNDPNRRRQAAGVVFSIGQIFQDRAARLARQTGGTPEERAHRQTLIHNAWQDVVHHYTGFVNRYARNGTLDQQIQGNVALGRGYWTLEDHTHATLYFRAAVAAWGEAPAAAAAGGEHPASPGEARIHEQLGAEAGDAIEKSRDSVAEARFYLAEEVYARFTARHLPVYHGAGTAHAFNAWVEHTLTPFITTQRTYLEHDATSQYQSVISMHVPNWEIAAAARLADMFFQFAQYIRTADVPPDVRRNPDLLDAWNVMRDERSQQFVDLAKVGFEACIRRSTDVHWFNEWSQLCERELNQIDRRQYPLADELRMDPNLLFSRATNSRAIYQLANVGTDEDEAGGSSGAPGAGGGLSGGADTSDSAPAAPAGGGGRH
ncbi:MAG: tetratricopeptide repeat protein [Thermoanaerobaculia bacterium]